MNNLIEIEGISKKYNLKKKITILKNLNFKFKKGKTYSLVGPSGSGKSTLLNLLSLIDKPSLGKIKIKDKIIDFNKNNLNDKIRSSEIGIIYQDKNLLSDFTALENVYLARLNLKSDKKTYQMDFRNSNEAFREIALDIKEGADMVMVKPGLPYLDIIKNIKDNFKIPVFVYQVSGEYSLIKYGIKNKLINDEAILESLMAFKRAGASAIITYFALDIADRIKKI